MDETVAYAIAMAWAPQLQGNVRLVVDRDGPLRSIVESYAWVRLDEPLPLSDPLHNDDTSRRHNAVSILRAVMVTWSALAACSGFSGAGNGTFWKRVISELQQQPTGRRQQRWRAFDRPEAVTDTHGFFDLPGHAFPRFMVEMPDVVDPAFDALFTSDGPCLSAGVREKLESLLQQIHPYRQDASLPAIDICLSRRDLVFRDAEDCRLATTIRDANAPTSNSTQLRIRQIHVREPISIGSDNDLDATLQFIRQIPVRIGHFQFTPRVPGALDTLSPAARAAWLQTFLQPGNTVQGHVTSLSFPRHYVSDAVFQALLSALPFATTLHSLGFSADCMAQVRRFEETDLLWLAYAIFHPNAASSSWRALDLDRLPLTPQCSYVLNAMARGNNLMALRNGTAPNCHAYYSAGVISGSSIQLEPRQESSVLLVAPPTGVAVDLCSISSLDRATWGEWVAVIVPAYGLGWVHADDLHHERAHAPGRPSLTGLRLRRELKRCDGSVNDPPAALLHLLRPLGAALSYLDISCYHDVSAQTMAKILGACGSLKVLVAGHAGELWSRDGSPHTTQLEELELVVRPSGTGVAAPTPNHIAHSLGHLRALRVRVDGKSQGNMLQTSRLMLERLLAHGPLLGYVHWKQPVGRSMTTYAARQSSTVTALEQLGLTDPKYLFAQLRMHPACAVAFLSVLHHTSAGCGSSALGRLVERGVLTTIFQFVTTRMQRSIHIEANPMDCHD